MRYSLFFFAAGQDDGPNPYALLLDCARWADQNAFEAVWLPERHLHSFGGLYPAPAVLGAALAVSTERVQIRAGSVVAPLNHPLRVAEAWSVVDRLSGGRVGISFASGWHREDFILADQPYARRAEVTRERIAQVKALWRGEAVAFALDGGDPVDAVLHPRPVQPELPTWVTTGGSPQSAAAAGASGAHLLTHLLGQGFDDLTELVSTYRAAFRPAPGGPERGTVTLMLHTHVQASDEQAVAEARPGFVRYLREAAHLQLRSAARTQLGIDPDELDDDDYEVLAEHAAQGYLNGQSLVGDVASCAAVVAEAEQCGVDEIGCLVDFVGDPDLVRSALPSLAALRQATTSGDPRAG